MVDRSKVGLLSLLLVTGLATLGESASPVALPRLQDLAKHVGEYPCMNGLLKAPVLESALRRILQGDFDSYVSHVAVSGCGAIERKHAYLVLDVSQLHVGGYTSIILVRESDGELFLLWLKSSVDERNIEVYGPKPIPDSAMLTFAHAMNVTWGHVACFIPEAGNLRVDTDHHANQDTGECRL